MHTLFVLLSMISVVIIGSGNVASHLFEAFKNNKEATVVQVVGRSEVSLSEYAKQVATASLDNITHNADVYILAVSDNAIPAVAKQFKLKDKLLVHTSGATSMDALKDHSKRGVFYPLQTFTKGKKVDFSSIALCLEAQEQTDLELLQQLANAISKKVYLMSSEQRKALHVAAIFASNFSNFMYAKAEEVCQEYQIPFEMLHPLILETAKKIEQLPPKEAQTGPARRGDITTLEAHKELIKNNTNKEIYSLISEAILHTYGKKL